MYTYSTALMQREIFCRVTSACQAKTIVVTNTILLRVYFTSKCHFLSLLNARHNTRGENNGHNSLRKSVIFNLSWLARDVDSNKQ